MTNASETGGVASAVINSGTCPEDAIEEHLRAALQRAENSDARFHIREALQLLQTE